MTRRQLRSLLWLLAIAVLVLTRPGPDEYAAWVMRQHGATSSLQAALGAPLVLACPRRSPGGTVAISSVSV